MDKEELRTQTEATKKKISAAVSGKKNSQYTHGQRSYRSKMGLKPNDGKMVHHKNGKRGDNRKSNLQVMKSKGPERSKHEKAHMRNKNFNSKVNGRQKKPTTATAKRLTKKGKL